MLWTDSDFITTADLLTLDAQIQVVSEVEIDTPVSLTGPNGVIRRATEEAADYILARTQLFTGGLLGGGHNAAVLNTGASANNHSKILITQVVVNSLYGDTWSPIKRWAAYWALKMFYRDVANRVKDGNDRYGDKLDIYERDIKNTYWPAVKSLGIPIVGNPLPRPASLYEWNQGTWDTLNVTPVADAGGTITLPVNVAVSWVDGSKVQNNESALSDPIEVILTAGNVLQVDIGSLNPPTGAQPPQTVPFATVSYGRATGWYIYVSVNGGPMVRQTLAPIDIGQKTHLFTGNPLTSGTLAGKGQYPDRYLSIKNQVTRA